MIMLVKWSIWTKKWKGITPSFEFPYCFAQTVDLESPPRDLFWNLKAGALFSNTRTPFPKIS